MPGPPSARFVRNLEDVLDLYAQPKDPDRPLVCFDETSKALHEHFRPPTPPRPGQPARYDYQYERMGTCNLFLCSAPLLGWRAVTVRTRRTAVDCAHVLRELVDVHFPEADKIVLVCDNLNTHTPKSLYKAFDKETAKRLAARLEWHYTPPHGSWLNMAECELSVLTRQCLNRRFPEQAQVAAEVAAWCRYRNAQARPVKWQCTTADARIKLQHLYPSF